MTLAREDIEEYVHILTEESKKDFGDTWCHAVVGILTSSLVWAMSDRHDREIVEKSIREKLKKN